MNTKEKIKQSIMESITPLFREVMQDESLVISYELDANQVDEWDSLNHITLIVALEEKFSIQFTTDELVAMENVGSLIDCLEAKGCTGDAR